MKKKGIVVVALCIALGGCAWVTAHLPQIATVGAVAGAISQVESAAVNALELKDRLERDD